MSMENAIRLIAGTFVLLSLALGWLVSPWWFLFTAFVGLNLIQSSFTRWCLMEDILAKLGLVKRPGTRAEG
jgi:Inner membrane protein YgaP-like, transmembrane domain